MPEHEALRRLSVWRVALAVVLLVGLAGGVFLGWERFQEVRANTVYKPWFAAYVDVTATPFYPIEELDTTPAHSDILSFIVSSPSDVCMPSWGGAYSLDQAGTSFDLDRRVARLRQEGGNVAIAFGGQKNSELALNCQDSSKLLSAYQSVIDRYNVNTVDLDLEGAGLLNTDALKRRAVAIAALQKEKRAKKESLAIWLTLPVSPQGLSEDGTKAVAQMLSSGVDLAGVNVMTMDYSNSLKDNETMEKVSEEALNNTHRQLGILYVQAGITLSSSTIWKKIGATPMIGQNDVANEVFTIDDAVKLNQFALSNGIGRMSMWSENRDIRCGDNYVDVKVVSDSCSGTKQDKLAFSTVLSKDFTGQLYASAAFVTTEDPNANIQQPDDPAASPYQIWEASAAYLAETKVVWHRNVYQAKWWTEGDIPDNPVLQAWQTPWQLLGPVMPGEKPVPQPTLPPGTYPDWSGATEYQAGQRVLLNGLPYQAKWWTKGDSPAIASVNPNNSPWIPLTKAQFDEVLKESTPGVSPKLTHQV